MSYPSFSFFLSLSLRMGINGYERHYLFRDGADCCDRYFKGSAGPCPSEFLYDPGYYWEKYENDRYNDGQFPTVYNHTYYPQMEAGTCVNGTDFPDWMNSDTEFRQRTSSTRPMYLVRKTGRFRVATLLFRTPTTQSTN